MGHSDKMQGKRVLITGAGTGIGREVALEYAREGAAVVLHYAHSAAGAETAVTEIEGAGGKAIAFKSDFTDVNAVKQLEIRRSNSLADLTCSSTTPASR